MKIAFGCDHAGYDAPEPYYKPELINYLESLGHEVIDCGTYAPGSVDYPDFGQAVCEKIQQGEAERGVLLCGTGIGISMAANRYPGIRAAVCVLPEMARLASAHNNANVICLGRRLLTLPECKTLIDIWLETPFDGGERHVRRINKLG